MVTSFNCCQVEAREVVLKFTEDGPIIHEDPVSGRSFALRATWTKPGASAYFNASWAWTAKTWDDFLVARDHWGAPPLNLLFANRAYAEMVGRPIEELLGRKISCETPPTHLLRPVERKRP